MGETYLSSFLFPLANIFSNSGGGTQFLSKFLVPNAVTTTGADDWTNGIGPKRRKTSLKLLAADLERAIFQREWFVTAKLFFDSATGELDGLFGSMAKFLV